MKKLLLLVMMLPMLAFGRKFYVSSSSGSDSYTTTQAQNPLTPWASMAKIQSSMSTFTAGDTIAFKTGDTFSGTLNITRSGTSTNPIVFTSYGSDAKPLFVGTGATIDYLIQSNNSYLQVNNIQIIDLSLTDTGRYEIAKIRRAITFRGVGCAAKSNEISRVGIGVYISQGSYATIDSNYIHHCKMIVNDPTPIDNDYGGAPVWLAGNNNTVTNNTCYSNWGISYDYGVDGAGFEFFDEGSGAKNNFCAYNLMYENDGLIETSYTGACDSNTIAYNKLVNNSSVAYFQDNCFGWKFYNNVIVETQLLLYPSPKTIFSGRSGYTSTMEVKNNAFQITTGSTVVNTARFSSFTHTNNVYKLSGGSVLGFTLGTAEVSTSATIWSNTTGTQPALWNYNPSSGSILINAGTNVGLTKDFGGNTVAGTPTIGVYQYTTALPCTFSYGAWSNCVGGTQTRPYVTSPLGCTGTPPTDSITRSCSVTPCSFTYSSWSNCINNTQTRTYIASPNGCFGTPPVDSLTRTCTPPPCTFTYGPWSVCTNGMQTRTMSTSPIGCTGTPPIDSLQRTCSSVKITYFYYNSSRKSIYVKVNTPGTLSVYNSLGQLVKTNTYIANGQWISMSSLPSGSYVATTFNKSITFRR